MSDAALGTADLAGDELETERGNPRGGATFGRALQFIKDGGRAARAGWNGKDMWIAYGAGREVAAGNFWNAHTRKFATANGGIAEVLPYILFKTADNKILMGWLASQTDMLATDWVLLP